MPSATRRSSSTSPSPKVLDGLFGMIETLFDVPSNPDSAPVWHESRALLPHRAQPASSDAAAAGRPVLPRPLRPPGKRPGAWMDDVREPLAAPGQRRTADPVAHLVCNFAAPWAASPRC
jgi:oligopeptidase A